MKKEIILLIVVVLIIVGIYLGKPYIEKKIRQEESKSFLNAAQSAFNQTQFDEETKKQQEAIDKMEQELKDKYGI